MVSRNDAAVFKQLFYQFSTTNAHLILRNRLSTSFPGSFRTRRNFGRKNNFSQQNNIQRILYSMSEETKFHHSTLLQVVGCSILQSDMLIHLPTSPLLGTQVHKNTHSHPTNSDNYKEINIKVWPQKYQILMAIPESKVCKQLQDP